MDKTSATGNTNNNPNNRVKFVTLKYENLVIRLNLSAMNWLIANFNEWVRLNRKGSELAERKIFSMQLFYATGGYQ